MHQENWQNIECFFNTIVLKTVNLLIPDQRIAFQTMMDSTEYPKNVMTSSTNSFHLISDEEALEDFQSVTLQMNDDHYDIMSPGSPQNQSQHQANSPTKKPDEEGQNGSEAQAQPTAKAVPVPTERTALLSLNTKKSVSLDQGDPVPRISITPVSPPSGSISPDAHSTVSLNSSGGSPLFQSQKYRGQMSMSPNLYWRPQSPMPPKNEFEAKEFFAYRDSIVQTVLDEVQRTVEPDLDGVVRGTWLLTE
jgi:hypothetical protein